MARVLITGGAGFIGANFVHHWCAQHRGEPVVVLDALTYAGNRANLSDLESVPGFTFVHGDIRDTPLVENLLRQHQLDTVVHFAAESHVDRSISGPDAFIETNVIGTHSLLKAARRVWLEEKLAPKHRFHHVSTDEVYGSLEPGDPAFAETTPYAPNSPYSASKAASDHLVRAYHHTYGLNTTISNCSNNYGPWHFPEKLIPLAIVNILRGRSIPVYGDGKNIRDWLHVSDHCRGIEAILNAGVPGQVYNIGGRQEVENLVLLRTLCAAADREFADNVALRARYPESPAARGGRSADLMQFVKDRPGHDRRYAIDFAKANRALGYSPTVDLDAGLASTLRWYIAHEPWWSRVG